MIKPRETLNNIAVYGIDEFYPDWKIKLDSNENPYGPCPNVIDTIRNFPVDKIFHYPAYGALVSKLADLLCANKSNFILTNGCDEAINVVLNAYLNAGDEVLTFGPTFSMPKLYCDVIGAKFVEIPYVKKWEFNLDIYLSKITDKTKILYLTSPNNPTGGLISPLDILYLAKNYKDKLVVLDCTYFNYSELLNTEYYSLVEKFDNLVILKSFSKDYALAGLRLGYAIANENIILELKKVISPYSVNAVALFAGLAALNSPNYFLSVKEKISKSKKLLVDELEKLGYKPKNTEANFILCDFGNKADFIYDKFLKNGIKVKYFKGINGLENTFRITAPKLEDVDKIIQAITPRPLFVFDLDGVIFDVSNSYRMAICKTFEHFTGKSCSNFDIQQVKNLGGMSNDWKVTQYLINKAGFTPSFDEIIDVFQGLFYNPQKTGSKGLIDNEKVVFNSDFFEELTKFADCAVFTSRNREEAFYSLEKFGIKKYFSHFICIEDVGENCKPCPLGLLKIKEACVFADIYYFGDTIDDVNAGVGANVKPFGIIPPNATGVDETTKKLKEAGAIDVLTSQNEVLGLVRGALCK